MFTLIDKIIIFVIATVLSIVYMLKDYTLAVLCISLIFTCLCYVIENRRGRIALVVSFAILSIVVPEFVLFIPLIVYDVIWSEIQLYLLIFIPPIILAIGNHSILVVYYLLFLGSAVFGKHKTNRILYLKKQYNTYRDTTTEYSNLLKEKNQQLILSQDYELKVATLNERNRISKELHDSIGHLLSRALIQVGALGVITKEEVVKSGLNDLKTSLSDGMDSVRTTIHNMRDDSFDLYLNIQELIKGFTYLPLHFEYNLKTEPSIKIKYCIISTIKEALANIMKHSNATEVSIAILEHTSLYQLVIYDNGKLSEIDKKNVESYISKVNSQENMGLSGMFERIELLEGIINISMNEGFKIFITVPKGKE